MKKTSFLTLEKAKEIAAQIPTPFHVYDEAPEKKLVMKIREGIVFMVIQHSQNTNIHSVCDIYRNNYVVFCYKCVDIIPEK